MRIGIDLSSWSNGRGYGRFTRGLVSALVATAPRHEFVGFVDAPTARDHVLPPGVRIVAVDVGERPTRAASAGSRRSIRDLWAMGRAVGRSPVDVLFFPTLYTWFPARTRALVVLGIHDVIAEEYPDLVFPDRRRRRLWTWKSRLARRRADYVVTVSGYAARGIRERLGWPGERLWVVEEAPDPVFRPLAPRERRGEILRERGVDPRAPFVLYVGGMNPHKNLVRLVEALAAVRSEGAELELVLAGDVEEDPFTPGAGPLRARIAELGLADAVTFTGRLDDRVLVHFLNAALAVVLPSRAEGFGLPAVEGAACGTPALATRNSPLPEILDGGGVFFDPLDGRAIGDALRAVLDPAERDRMGRAALHAASRLDWTRSARSLLARLEAAVA